MSHVQGQSESVHTVAKALMESGNYSGVNPAEHHWNKLLPRQRVLALEQALIDTVDIEDSYLDRQFSELEEDHQNAISEIFGLGKKKAGGKPTPDKAKASGKSPLQRQQMKKRGHLSTKQKKQSPDMTLHDVGERGRRRGVSKKGGDDEDPEERDWYMHQKDVENSVDEFMDMPGVTDLIQSASSHKDVHKAIIKLIQTKVLNPKGFKRKYLS